MESIMTTINQNALNSLKELVHYKGAKRNGDNGVKDLIDKVKNTNKIFIFENNSKSSFFRIIFDYIKEVFNVKISYESIIKNNKYEKTNNFYNLKLLNDKNIINSNRVTIKYDVLNEEISSFLQEKMMCDKNNSNLINKFLKEKVKTKGDFLLFYSILNKLMNVIINKKNEDILKIEDTKYKFKFIAESDLFYKNNIFNRLNDIFYDYNVKICENIISNKTDLKKLYKITGIDSISNLTKFIDNLKENEIRNEVFFLMLDNALKKLNLI